MKISIYILFDNETPYYVGVTTNPKGRYGLEKRGQMCIVDTTNNRLEARMMEEYWINQLKEWGFPLTNKELAPIPIKRMDNDGLITKRFKITKNQASELHEIEFKTNADPSLIVRYCIDEFFKLLQITKTT